MLEKPDFPDEKIIACLRAEYGLAINRVAFLPLGADQNTAVYRAAAPDETPYFVKLRRGDFDELAVTLPRFLSDQDLAHIVAPIATLAGRLWASLPPFNLILYPYIEGRNGYQVDFSARHWADFGQALRSIHSTTLPPALLSRLARETFSPQWRESMKTLLARLDEDIVADPVAVKLAAFLRAKRAQIAGLVQRTERHAQALQARPLEFVLCHSDVHAGNLLIGPGDELYLVDWDNPILAPKERDLMFAGGGQGFRGHTPQEEVDLFFRGYGPARVDSSALAYYRCERIIQDLAVFCEQLLLTEAGGEDREQSFGYLQSNFVPGGTIELAVNADNAYGEGHEV